MFEVIIDVNDGVDDRYLPNECHVARTLRSASIPHRNRPLGTSTSVTANEHEKKTQRRSISICCVHLSANGLTSVDANRYHWLI
jgi:hypothetical protein